MTDPLTIYILLGIVGFIPLSTFALTLLLLRLHTEVLDVKTISEESRAELNYRLTEFKEAMKREAAMILAEQLRVAHAQGKAEGIVEAKQNE